MHQSWAPQRGLLSLVSECIELCASSTLSLSPSSDSHGKPPRTHMAQPAIHKRPLNPTTPLHSEKVTWLTGSWLLQIPELLLRLGEVRFTRSWQTAPTPTPPTSPVKASSSSEKDFWRLPANYTVHKHSHPAAMDIGMEAPPGAGEARGIFMGTPSPPKSIFRRMLEGLKRMLRKVVSVKLQEWISDYCRENGLLTLSVLAVVSGCVIGYMLRSLNLSSQVRHTGSDNLKSLLLISHKSRNNLILVTGNHHSTWFRVTIKGVSLYVV